MAKIKIQERKFTATVNGNEGYERHRFITELGLKRGTGGYNICMYKNIQSLKRALEPLDEGAVKPSEEFVSEFGKVMAQPNGQVELNRLLTEGTDEQIALLKEYQAANVARINELADIELEVTLYSVLDTEMPEDLTAVEMSILDQMGLLTEDDED
jgi:hypothetical protein